MNASALLALKSVVKKLPIISDMVVAKHQKLRERHLNELDSRAFIDCRDVQRLVKDIGFSDWFTSEPFKENEFYGTARVIRNYACLSENYPLLVSIQHGISFAKCWEPEQYSPFTLLCWGKKIAELRRAEMAKPVIAIGAPFFYSKSLFSKERMEEERHRLGPNLLFFPAHSTHFVDVDYDQKRVVDALLALRKDFASIRVCLYWRDCQRGLDKAYMDKGFECVTAGHMFDHNFIPRLRFLIETCDCIAFNRIGSFTGYGIALNKPCKLISPGFKMSLNQNKREPSEAFEQNKDYIELCHECEKNSWSITPRQREISALYWGSDLVKRPEEMRDILKAETSAQLSEN